MKVFFTILVLAALAGGGYYYFIHQENTVGSLLGRDRGALAGTDKNPVTPENDRTGGKAKGPKSTPKSDKKGKAAPVTPVKRVEPPKSEIDLLVEKRYPMPTIRPLNDITQNWSSVPPNAYPDQIVASEPVPFTLMINGQPAGSSKVPAGTPLKPILLANGQLTVASLVNSTMRSQVAVEKTNFKQAIEKRYNDFVVNKKNQIANLRSKAKAALLAQPDRLASLQTTGPGDPSGDPRFAPVKASIRRGEAHPASIDEATSFRWNGSERVGGEMRGSYDTVSVHFEVTTIFGKFPTDYKCLLRGGQVVGWIDPITEEKITKN